MINPNITKPALAFALFSAITLGTSASYAHDKEDQPNKADTHAEVFGCYCMCDCETGEPFFVGPKFDLK